MINHRVHREETKKTIKIPHQVYYSVLVCVVCGSFPIYAIDMMTIASITCDRTGETEGT